MITEKEIYDLNLSLLTAINQEFNFKGSDFDKSVLALGLYNACNEIGFEKLPPKLLHTWLVHLINYREDFEGGEDGN